jgi:hypothetical protein
VSNKQNIFLYRFIDIVIVSPYYFSMKKNMISVVIVWMIWFAVMPTASAQNKFDVSLMVDFSSAEQLLDYFDHQTANSARVAELRGNRLASATSVMLARTNRYNDDVVKQMELARDLAQYNNDLYGLLPAKQHIAELRKLLTEAKRRQIDRRVIATLQGYFPADTKLFSTIKVYMVAMGNEKAAAVVRRVVWHGDVPQFVGEEEGEPVIIFNLARVIETSSDVQIQFLELLATLAHESFHAVFSKLKETLPGVYSSHSPSDELLDIVQNEGIAYYLSLEIHRQGRPLSPEWFNETAKAVDALNHALTELSSPGCSPTRARQLLMDANLSGSFSGNYGATAGLRMAYEIDTRLGRQALTSTLVNGTQSFVDTYRQACVREQMLPQIDAQAGLQK